MQKICVIIPCFNEEKRLEVETFSDFIRKNDVQFCFVNDGSTDKTLSYIEEIKKAAPEMVCIIDLKKNKGKAEAVRIGFLKAFEEKQSEIIGFLDADLSTPLEEIKYLALHFDNSTKIVIGARVKRLGAKITRSLKRHYLGRIFATYANFLLGIRVYDSQCGAKFFQREVVKILFSESFKTEWLFDLEILRRYYLHNQEGFDTSIHEVPLRTWNERQGSKIKLIYFVRAPFEILKIRG